MTSSVEPQPGRHLSNDSRTRNSRDGLSSRTDSATVLPGERLSEDAEDRAMETHEYDSKHEAEGDANGAKDRIDADTTSEDDIMWVDWDGPGDPTNPKKCVIRSRYVSKALICSQLAVSKKMGSYARRFILHIYIPRLLIHGCASHRANSTAVRNYK
jgi:hypothetical protein